METELSGFYRSLKLCLRALCIYFKLSVILLIKKRSIHIAGGLRSCCPVYQRGYRETGLINNIILDVYNSLIVVWFVMDNKLELCSHLVPHTLCICRIKTLYRFLGRKAAKYIKAVGLCLIKKRLVSRAVNCTVCTAC